MDSNKALFETIPVRRSLAKMAVPTILSQLITMIYNLADTFFIGRTNNAYMVAAVSLAYVLFFILTALSNLFGVGGGSLIARLMGQGNSEESKKVCSFSFYGTIIISALYSVGCYAFMEPLLRLLGATDNTMLYSSQYTLWVIVAGGVPSCLSMVMGHLLRSVGYAKIAGLGLGGGGVLNMILDPIFMFVLLEPGNEVVGAAIATMISNVVTFVFFAVVFFVLRKKTVLCVSPRQAFPRSRSVVSVFSVGLPSAVGSLLSCASNTVINKLVSGYNDFAVAAMGIVKKLDMLPMNVAMGLCQAMVPLVAYNYSAKNYSRMHAFATAARNAGMAFAVICIIAFELFASRLVTIFIGDAETVRYGIDFLRIAVLATPFMIFNFLMSFTFQAMGKGARSLLLTSCRQGIVNIPLLFLMNAVFGLYGVIWTQLVADVITMTLSAFLFARMMSALRKEEAALSSPPEK